MNLTSPAFGAGAEIPSVYTCEGKNISPPLSWSAVPAGTRSLALIVDDPDAPDPKAPKTTYVHWVVYDIPPSTPGIPEAATSSDLPRGTRVAFNDFKRQGYGGPCPPIGRHRYFFKLYALDTLLPELKTKKELEKAMEGHVLASSELWGTYEKKNG
jgi:Raf kinase inhibitor-like YbhB/YbcL family protein